MKMEPLRGGCLKIWMTQADMQHWGLQFDRMDARDEATRRAVLRLITVARERLALGAISELTVEALPIDGGCLLLLTPLDAAPLFRRSEPVIYTVRSADDLLCLGRGLCRLPASALPSSSLFGWERGYRLIVYPDATTGTACRRLLSEFSEATAKGRAAAAYTEEHGEPLLIGDALQRLQV